MVSKQKMEQVKYVYKLDGQSYRISVSYFLRKDMGQLEKLLVSYSDDKGLLFPIYIRVLFLQQNVKIRSRLQVRLREGEFESYMKRPEILRFIDNEALTIFRSVEKLKPHEKVNFSIFQWSDYYAYRNKSIFSCIEKVISQQFKDEFTARYEIESSEMAFVLFIDSFSGISLLSKIENKLASEYILKFKPLFDMKKYEDAICEDALFCLWDWDSGVYKSEMTRVHGDQAEGLLLLVEELLYKWKKDNFYSILHN